MESTLSTEWSEARRPRGDGTPSGEGDPTQDEAINTTAIPDATPLNVAYRLDHDTIPDDGQLDLSPCISPDTGSQLHLSGSLPMNTTTNGARESIIDGTNHLSANSSHAVESNATESGSPSSEHDEFSHHSGSSDEDEMGDDNNGQDEEELQGGTSTSHSMYPDDDTENISNYRSGGFHPIHIGDILDDRFEVVHKLGYGGFATVWLCLEETKKKWWAVKIVRADHSSEEMPELALMKYMETLGEFDPCLLDAHHISLPLEYFWLEGPNGRHICEVFQVHGPSIYDKWQMRVLDDGLARLNDTIFQVAMGVKFLHDRGICHGDLTPKNILVKLQDISHLGKQEVIDLLGKPQQRLVNIAGDSDTRPTIPRYTVVPTDTRYLGIRNDVVISDFGESFRPSEKKVDSCGIPMRYASPEATFCCDLQLPSDIWSLAFVILQVAANGNLLADFNDLEDYVINLEVALGPLPQPYRTGCVNKLKEIVIDSGEDWEDYVECEASMHLPFRIPKKGVEPKPDEPLQLMSPLIRAPWISSAYRPSFNSVKSYHEERASKCGYENPFEIFYAREIRLRRFTMGPNETIQNDPNWELMTIKLPPKKEIELFGDLLSRMVKYDHQDRLDIDEVLRHEWFTRNRVSTDSEATVSRGNASPTNVDKGRQEDSTSHAGTGELPEDDDVLVVTPSPEAEGPGSNFNPESHSATQSTSNQHPPTTQSTIADLMAGSSKHACDERSPMPTIFQLSFPSFILLLLMPGLYFYIMVVILLPHLLRMNRRT